MRDRFSELIKQGVASFKSVPVGDALPNTDPICRQWNNIFSIPSNTHMHMVDGQRIITGRMVNITQDFEKFLISPFWGAVSYRSCGYWCPSDFLYKQGLKGEYGTANGEQCYLVYSSDEPVSLPSAINAYITMGNKIPQPIAQLVNNRDANKLKECFQENLNKTAQNMNESLYVKGNNWIVKGNNIIGMVGNEVIIL